jgi:hypothetical protein
VIPHGVGTPKIGVPEIGRDALFGERQDTGLQVIVIYTTPHSTLGALNAAGTLAKDLGARVGLVVTEVVPFRLPLDQPRVSIDFLRKQQELLVSKAGIEEEIRVQILVCRDRNRALSQILPPHSLVMFGGRSGWWARRERKLNRFLSRSGHQVVFVKTD